MMEQNLPKHVAIIMDGNGRWAKKRGLPRIEGHRRGMKNLKTIATAASDIGIKALTVYAFSTENWKRPLKEVEFLMSLPINFFSIYMPDLMKNNVKVMITGFKEQLPKKTRKVCEKAVNDTKDNTGMILNFAFNYGSRADIINATKNIANQVKAGNLDVDQIDDKVFASNLKTVDLGDLQDPDFLIRTSGEQRISNFYLWELAYSEMIFVDELWPDYTPENLTRDLKRYQNRDRRFGGLNDK